MEAAKGGKRNRGKAAIGIALPTYQPTSACCCCCCLLLLLLPAAAAADDGGDDYADDDDYHDAPVLMSSFSSCLQ